MKMYAAPRNSNLLCTTKIQWQLENLVRRDINSLRMNRQSRNIIIKPRLIKRTQKIIQLCPIHPNIRITVLQLRWDSKIDATRASVLANIIKSQTTTKISWRSKKSQLHLFLQQRRQRSPLLRLRLKKYLKKILHLLNSKIHKRKLYYKCIENRQGSQKQRRMQSSWLFQLISTRLFNLIPKLSTLESSSAVRFSVVHFKLLISHKRTR